MDINFKGALELYDYIVSYEGEGYRIENDEKEISPFTERVGDEFAEFISMTAFLTYQYGRDKRAVLEAAYREEEDRRAQEREQEERRRLSELKAKITENGGDPIQYMLLLEKRNGELEGLIPELSDTKDKVRELEGTLREERKRKSELLGEIDDLKEVSAEKDAQMHRMTVEHQEENARVRTEAQSEIARASAENQARLTEAQAECESRVSAVTAECEERVVRAEGELSQLREEHTLTCAELLAQKQLNGVQSDEDFTERERFEQLEREYEALGKLLEGEWKKTKRKIRRRVLWKKS